MKLKIFVILCITFQFATTSKAQTGYQVIDGTPLKFEKLNPEDGLIHNSITCIFQDSKGYMWFGSFNGLYKYDGYNYSLFNNNRKNENSLIGNDILTINEDDSGLIWIGTTQGLCWYDRSSEKFGRSLSVGNKELSIKDKVYCIYQDTFGVIWIGTEHGLYQVNRKDKKSKITRYVTNHTNQGISDNAVKTIAEDKNNNLWVGTKNGLNKVVINRQGKPVFTRYFADGDDKNSLSNNFITSSLIDNKGDLWVGTKYGLNKLSISKNEKTNTFIKYYHDRENTTSLANNYVTAICQDINNDLWIGTRYGGASRFSNEKFTTFQKDFGNTNSLSSNEISCILNDNKGVLWMGVIAGRVNKLDLNKKGIAHYKLNPLDETSLSDNIVNAIYEDSNNQIWVGTHNGGINRLVLKDGIIQFENLKHEPSNSSSLSSNNVFSFCEDNYGNYWVGTEDQGLNHINLSFGEKLQAAKVIRFNKSNNTIPSDNISILFKDHIGDIWMGSFDGDGLMKFSPKAFGDQMPNVHHFKHSKLDDNSLSSNNISCIYEDSFNRLWVGTFGAGLMRIDRDARNFPINFHKIENDPKNENSLSNNNVFGIAEGKNGDIWVATFGGGLNKIESHGIESPNLKIIRYGENNGLTNNELYGILEDEQGNFWLSSNKGIYKFDVKKEIFTNFQTSDGLQALNFRKFSYTKDRNNLMFFGGINGFNVFNPEHVIPNTFIPNVEIVDLKVFNQSIQVSEKVNDRILLEKSISETDSITFPSSINNFTLEFSGLHFASPEQNKYKYKLDGFDENWRNTSSNQRYATYSNLNAGTYKFMVKASNNDQIWNENPKILIINILPPWWKTWWAYSIYALIIVGLMFIFRYFIMKKNDFQNKLKIEKIEQENLKRLNAAKIEFFTNISHELRTPLTLILGPLQQLIDADSVDTTIKKTLKSIDRNAKNLYKLINQVLEFRRIENKESPLTISEGDLVKFIQEIVDSFYFFAQERKLELNFTSNKSSYISGFDWDKLEKVMNNLISNCLKYTPEKGKIAVSLLFSKDQDSNNNVELIVEDTGIGIPNNQLALIFNRFYQINNSNRSSSMGSGIGLALTKALVELHQGSITVKSKEGVGSKFIIKFPLPITENNTNFKHIKEPAISDFKEPMFEQINTNASNGNVIENLEEDNNLPLLLIVEDNEELQQFMFESLKESYTIIQAFDGEIGVEMAINKVPDIILSDIMMPIKDGIQLCDEIKRNSVTNHIPLVLLSARSSIEHRIEGLEVGADSYISKPFHIKHLKVTLRELIKQRKLLKEKFSFGSNDELNMQSQYVNKFEKAFMEKIQHIILENLNNPQFGVNELGEALNFSRMQLYRKLKSISGMAANEFIREFRIKQAAKFIEESEMNISEIAFDVGFNNLSYFTKCFKQVYEVSPSQYAKKFRKKTIS